MSGLRSTIVTVLVALTACSSDAPVPSVPPLPDSRLISSDGTQLAYTIDWPAGTGPFPAVVLVHGSGPVTRDQMAGFSRRFTELGWAVLRYDKRGVGESQGEYRGVSIANSDVMVPLLAQDAAAAFALLARNDRVDRTRIGFAGASQAGWIIPPALTLAPSANVAVILVGPTVSVGTEIRFSNLAEQTSLPIEQVYEELEGTDGPHGFDPASAVERITARVLWLYGADDRSVPTRLCVEIHDRLRLTAPTPSIVKVYPGVGHELSGEIWPDIAAFLNGIPDRE